MTKEQFIQLYDSHFDAVSKFLSYYTCDKAELEDLIQEVFLRIWNYRDKVDLNNAFLKTYLLKTARNVALTSITKKEKNSVDLAENMEEYPEQEDEAGALQRSNFPADYELALNQAPQKARMVYLMNREDGYTYGEIAQALQISPKTVEVHVGKVLRVLRKELRHYQF